MPARQRRRGALLIACCLLLLSACGATVSSQPVASTPLESLIALRNLPIYWLGSSFQGLPLTEVVRDSSGGVALSYGLCVRGGQYQCLAPLTVVTSPEASFLPRPAAGARLLRVRGTHALSTEAGRTYVLPTGPVVVYIYAQRRELARAAARELAAINRVIPPGLPLPAPAPTSAFATKPLADQMLLISPAHAH